jgi:hypothetical protein
MALESHGNNNQRGGQPPHQPIKEQDKMNKQEQNYFADLRTPKKGENLHDQDRFRHEVMERIIESRQLQAEPKRYRRVTDWDKVASFAFGLFTVALFILWLFIGGVK